MEMKDYRQPMVTSLGVILGFLIGFLGQWVTEAEFKLSSAADYLVFMGCIISVVLLLVSLYRMLSAATPTDVKPYYQLTLKLYMTGIVIAFSSILISAFI